MNPQITSDPASLMPVAANRDDHLLAVAQITADEFANGQYVDEISQQYFATCHYDWDTTRLVLDGETLAHHWGVWGYPMRIESAHLRVAGVGAVVTREAYRSNGLMHRAALASFEAMRENGYDLSVLRGRHYAKYGYVRAWNYVTTRVKPDDIPQRELTAPYQALGPEHMDAIIDLYNATYAGFSGSAVRPTYRMLNTGDMGAHGWFDANDKLIGYVRAVPNADTKTLQCLEATGDPDQALAVLADLFKQDEYETLAFFTLPDQHPVLQIIRRGACTVEHQYFYHTGWQVRIVNLDSTLRKLCPLFEARIQRSHFARWSGTLLLDAGEQSAVLALENGTVTLSSDTTSDHAIHAGPALARLLIGSDDPGEIMQQEQTTTTGQAADLMRVLFANLRPVLSHWDEY